MRPHSDNQSLYTAYLYISIRCPCQFLELPWEVNKVHVEQKVSRVKRVIEGTKVKGAIGVKRAKRVRKVKKAIKVSRAIVVKLGRKETRVTKETLACEEGLPCMTSRSIAHRFKILVRQE